ncbi:MAG: S8 family serine peptidase [bacterium]
MIEHHHFGEVLRSRLPLRLSAPALTVACLLASASVAFGSALAPVGTLPYAEPPIEFVPGEVIFQLTEEAASASAQQKQSPPDGRTGLASVDERLAAIGAASIAPLFDIAADAMKRSEAGLDRIYVARFDAQIAADIAAQSLAGVPGVAFAEPNYIARASFAPNDPMFPLQWGHDNGGQATKYTGGTTGTPDGDSDTPEAWDLTTGSASLILAILDTGIDAGHPEFAGRVLPGYDFVNNDANPNDDHGHGTACAGIAAAAGNNGVGIAGVAWNVKILPVKVLNASGAGSYSQLASGITYAADSGARILSLSLGGPASAVLQAAVDYAANTKGCALFCAVGNSNRRVIEHPAALPNAIGVGALAPCSQRKFTVSCDCEWWWGSNYGAGLDFLAPGVRIHTTDIRGAAGLASGDYYSTFNGTSAAAPFAAGVGALVMSRNPALSNTELLALLQNTCDDLGAVGLDVQTGYGRLNAARAVENAGGDGSGGDDGDDSGDDDGNNGGDDPIPPVTIFSENFEGVIVPGAVWAANDANTTNGNDYWGEQTSGTGARVYGGTRSAYAADNSSVTGQRYDSHMSSQLALVNPIPVSPYSNVQLSFWKWHETYNASDYLAFEYWNGTAWVEQQRWSGASSEWTNVTLALTGFTTLQFRFMFFSNASGTLEGAYVDDIILTGVPSASGQSATPEPVAVSFVSEVTAEGVPVEQERLVEAPASAPLSTVALAITPNPARDQASIRYSIPTGSPVVLELFSVDGRRVRSLESGWLTAGNHIAAWDGRDAAGRDVAAGIYFARLIVGDNSSVVERIVLMR